MWSLFVENSLFANKMLKCQITVRLDAPCNYMRISTFRYHIKPHKAGQFVLTKTIF